MDNEKKDRAHLAQGRISRLLGQRDAKIISQIPKGIISSTGQLPVPDALNA